MKTRRFLFLAGALLVAAGCASVDSRIASNRAVFESWPFAVQQKVAAGQVDLAFTPEQVQMALGAPDRIATRVTNDGTSQSWVYRNRGPRFGFGLGLGTGHGGTSYGGGVAVNDWPLGPDESLRVVFDGGKVSAIESARRD
jgi:hypothetical protein